MAELSQVQARVTEAKRRTNNRSSLLPSRRDTDAARRRGFTDILSAGDGGKADALKESLGLLKDAVVTGASQYHEAREEKLGAQGVLDGLSGKEDPEAMRSSLAYKSSFTTQRAQAAYLENREKLDDRIKEVLNNQNAASPEERVAELLKLLDDNRTELLIDPETKKLRDFGSPAAAKWLGEALLKERAELTPKLHQLVEEKMATESINTQVSIFGKKLRTGDPVTFEENFQFLPPTVDRKAFIDAAIVEAKSIVLDLDSQADVLEDEGKFEEANALRVRARHILQSLRGSKREQPTAVVTSAGPVDPLAPLPEGAVPPPPAAPTPAEAAAPVKLVQPFQGFNAKPSSGMGAPRQGGSSHNGEDFPAPEGTAVVAPMGGTVLKSFRNARGGHQVRVKLDNGAIVGFAHLSKRDVSDGTRVEAGQQLGLSGNTGKSSGSHVHMTVEVNGRKVSPSAYFKNNGGTTPATETAPGVDLASVPKPPSLDSLVASTPDTSNIAAPSGAFSLSPQTRAELGDLERQLGVKHRQRTEQAKTKQQDQLFYEMALGATGFGTYPTRAQAQQAVREGRLRPEQYVSIHGMIEADERRAGAEAKEAAGSNTERRLAQVDAHANGLIARYFKGERPDSIRKSLATLLPTIEDREVRQAVAREVTQAIDTDIALKLEDPLYRGAMTQFDDWEAIYLTRLSRATISREDAPQAERIVKQWVNKWRVALGRSGLDPDRVPVFMKQAEEELDRAFQARFPPRRVAPRQGSYGR